MATTSPPAARTRFAPARREKAKLRMAIDGPSGSGKTYTALRLAAALGGKVAVIDSEHGSAALYKGEQLDGAAVDFDHCILDTFSPQEYTAAIEDAAQRGYPVLVIDSLSHAWEGIDGALEIVSKKGGNSYTAWKDVTPIHRRMVEAILHYPGHVFVTMRSKTEYVLETNDKGKQVPRKVGMAPIQRPGMEYEFTIYMSMDWSNIGTVVKSRCSAVTGAIVHKPGAAFLAPVIAWLDTGEASTVNGFAPTSATGVQITQILDHIQALGKDVAKEKQWCFRRWCAGEFTQLTMDQAREYEARLRAELAKKPKGGDGDGKKNEGQGAAPPYAEAENEVENQTLQEALAAQQPQVTGDGHLAPDARCCPEVLARVSSAREQFFASQGLDPIPENKARRDAVWAAVLAKRGVKTAKDLSNAQAIELEERLYERVAALVNAAGSAAEKK